MSVSNVSGLPKTDCIVDCSQNNSGNADGGLTDLFKKLSLATVYETSDTTGHYRVGLGAGKSIFANGASTIVTQQTPKGTKKEVRDVGTQLYPEVTVRSTGLGSKTKILIGAISAVAFIAFGMYVASKVASGDSKELEACMEVKNRIENTCAEQIAEARAATTVAQTALKQAVNHCANRCKDMFVSIDKAMTCTVTSTGNPAGSFVDAFPKIIGAWAKRAQMAASEYFTSKV